MTQAAPTEHSNAAILLRCLLTLHTVVNAKREGKSSSNINNNNYYYIQGQTKYTHQTRSTERQQRAHDIHVSFGQRLGNLQALKRLRNNRFV